MLNEMLKVFRGGAVVLAALTAIPAFAHVLELPGKRQLNREEYRAVQRIYYPGFTLAGLGEGIAPLWTTILLGLTLKQRARAWPPAVALLGFLSMQVVYWRVTHPVNQYWLEGQQLGQVGTGFFALNPAQLTPQVHAAGEEVDWTTLRDRWEYSHVVRAGCALLSLLALSYGLAQRERCR
jgi:hypothetical protein